MSDLITHEFTYQRAEDGQLRPVCVCGWVANFLTDDPIASMGSIIWLHNVQTGTRRESEYCVPVLCNSCGSPVLAKDTHDMEQQPHEVNKCVKDRCRRMRESDGLCVGSGRGWKTGRSGE
jgi:hypothetical protein